MDRYYVPDLSALLEASAPLVLEGQEARHLGQVKRARPGAEVLLFDGRGSETWARVEAVERRRIRLTAIAQATPGIAARIALTVALAVPERKRLLWAVEKCTELAVSTLLLLDSERTDERPGSPERLHARAVEAAKQCGVLRVPAIEGPVQLDEALARPAAVRVILDPRAEDPLLTTLDVVRYGDAVTLVVGPPGGFTADELRAAVRPGVRAARLGGATLRTETAAVSAAAVAMARGDLV